MKWFTNILNVLIVASLIRGCLSSLPRLCQAVSIIRFAPCIDVKHDMHKNLTCLYNSGVQGCFEQPKLHSDV